MRKRVEDLLLLGFLLAVLAAYIVGNARASGMMGVGQLMGDGGGASGPPPETFYLTNDAGDILTNDAGTNLITTE